MPGVNLPKDFDAEAHKKRSRKFANTIPTRENCDLDNPQEMFLWMLVALPGQNGGQQAMPSSYNMLVSEALHRRGAMLKCDACGHMKEPTEVYVPPGADDPHWMSSPGKWKRKEDAPESAGDPFDQVLDKMHASQQAAFLARLLKRKEEGMFDA